MVLAETTGTDTIRYLHGLDLVAQSDGVSIEYFAYDGLGSVRQVLDAAGLPLMAQTFDPYGNPYAYTGPTESATSYGFTGEQTDSNGLVFLRARYYHPAQGRFTQMDPSRQEDNPYRYAASNPVMLIDPSGMCSVYASDYQQCMQLRNAINFRFGVTVDIPQETCNWPPDVPIPADFDSKYLPVAWTREDLSDVYDALDLLERFWTRSSFKTLFTPVTLRKIAGTGPAHLKPFDPAYRVTTPIVVLNDVTFAPHDKNTPIGTIWGEFYHLMDYNLSGRPGRAWESGWWQLEHALGVVVLGENGPNPKVTLLPRLITTHSGKFGKAAGWIMRLSGIQRPASSPGDLWGGTGYGTIWVTEDFAHTYQVLTQALIGGLEVCTSHYLIDKCIKSNVVSNLVHPHPNFWIDDGRLGFFLSDAERYNADINSTYRPN